MRRSTTVRSVRILDGGHILSVNGDLAGFAVEALREELETVAASDARHVIIDLLDVPFVDAAALELFLTGADRLAELSGELHVVSDDPRVLRLLELTGATRRVSVERTLSAAVSDVFDRAYP